MLNVEFKMEDVSSDMEDNKGTVKGYFLFRNQFCFYMAGSHSSQTARRHDISYCIGTNPN